MRKNQGADREGLRDDYRLRVLEELDPGGRVSGARLARSRGFSASGLGKTVGWLRRRGYGLEGGYSHGYRLISRPDELYPEEVRRGLPTRRLGRKVHYFAEIDSTNALAQELARAGEAEGTTVAADRQLQGRGRLERSWFSPPGVNVYASLILRPRIKAERVPQISLLAALALALTLARELALSPGVKWPNDVYLNGKKVAGILSTAHCRGEEADFVVLGVGLNVNRFEFPAELEGRATSIADSAGKTVSRVRLFQAFLKNFEKIYYDYLTRGFTPFRKEWEQWSILKGRRVRVSGATESTGRVEGIDETGALIIREDRGESRVIRAGDIILAREEEEKNAARN